MTRQQISLYCPLPRTVHPRAAQADAAAGEWMRRFGLCANDTTRAALVRSGCGRLAAHMLPTARNVPLQIAADLCMWNVAFDDEYCDEGQLGRSPAELAEVLAHIQRAVEVPEQALYTDDRYAAALHDIRTRLDGCATPAQVTRWVEAIRTWLMTEIWRSGIEYRKSTLSLDEYVLLRLCSGGAFAFLTLPPIAEGYEVTADDLARRPVHALVEMAASLVTWAADIVGHVQDGRDENGNNLVTVLRHAHDCTLTAAVHRATVMHEQVMRQFLVLREVLLRTASPELARYLHSLSHVIRCGIDWVSESSRYSRSGGPPHSEPLVRSRPSTARAAPLPLPSIAWWWQHGPCPPPYARR